MKLKIYSVDGLLTNLIWDWLKVDFPPNLMGMCGVGRPKVIFNDEGGGVLQKGVQICLIGGLKRGFFHPWVYHK